MNSFEYHGHTVEIKLFEGHGVAFPSLHDVYVDGVRRNSGFLKADDARLYGQALVDEVDKIPALRVSREAANQELTYSPIWKLPGMLLAPPQ